MLTVSGTLAAAEVYSSGSDGVNVTESVCDPAASTVPCAGEYANVPGTPVVAFNCAALRGVPYAIAADVGHRISGVFWPMEADRVVNVPPHPASARLKKANAAKTHVRLRQETSFGCGMGLRTC